MSDLFIRLAGPEDAALIADFSRQTFYDTFAAQNTPANMDKFMREQFAREALIKEVSEPGNIFLLALLGKDIAGYARLRENHFIPELAGKNAMEIARIYAATHIIGKGVGSALIQRCIDTATEKKKNVIWLGVWEQNKRAIDFYTRWGFEKFSTHVFLLGDDPQTDWLMKKELAV
jgi:diamine N-acetyltransferase